MSIAIPLALNELEDMRYLLRKADIEGELQPDDERRLREYISRQKPTEAQNSDLGALILVGLFLLGLYVTLLLIENGKDPELLR
ncbi:hypothetical protein McpSp1_09210 [Methanocorpusculaceae archaeon Sp1]|nr:hypothetical protein [Methanocorpusculaceae archaeon Sp1]